MRSMAPSASSGRVPQVGARNSHSFGPREPNCSRNSSKAWQNFDPSGSLRSRSTSPSTPWSNCAVRAGDARHLAGQVPQAPAGGGRVDAADAGHQPHRHGRVAELGADALDDPERHGRAVADEDVLAEEVAEPVHVVAGERQDLLVRHGREVGPAGHRLVDHALVVDQLGQVLLREDPPEGLVDPLGVGRALVGGPGLVGRRVGRAEEALVHQLGREPGRADGEDPRHRHVEVRVAAEAAEDLDLVRVELVEVEGAEALEGVAPARLGTGDGAERPRQRRHRLGEHLADVARV